MFSGYCPPTVGWTERFGIMKASKNWRPPVEILFFGSSTRLGVLSAETLSERRFTLIRPTHSQIDALSIHFRSTTTLLGIFCSKQATQRCLLKMRSRIFVKRVRSLTASYSENECTIRF